MLVNCETKRDAEELLRAVKSWVRDAGCTDVGPVLESLDEAVRLIQTGCR